MFWDKFLKSDKSKSKAPVPDSATPELEEPDYTAADNQARRKPDTVQSDEIERLLKDIDGSPFETEAQVPMSSDEIEQMLVQDLTDSGHLNGLNESGASLLQSLEPTDESEFGEEDENLLSDIPESKLAELKNMFKMLEANEDIQSKMNATAAAGSSDLDNKIMEALAKDRAEETRPENDSSFIEDITVFNLEGKKNQPIEGETKEEATTEETSGDTTQSRAKKLPVKRLYLFAGILAVLVTFSGSFAVTMLFSRSTGAKDAVNIAQPLYAANESNYIFMEHNVLFNGRSIGIYKMLIDPTTTVFYLNQYLDVYACNINMVDENGKTYFMDLSALPERLALSGPTAAPERTALFLEPLDGGIRQFSLLITDPVSGEEATFNFLLEEKLRHTPVQYMSGVMITSPEKPDVSLSIENGVFSSAGSKFDFKLSPKNRAAIMDSVEAYQNIEMTENGRPVLPTRSTPAAYHINENSEVFGRADFEALKGLSGNINVAFNGLYQIYALQETIPVLSLVNLNAPYQTILELDQYNVFIERMIPGSDKFVLVLHTEDTSIGGSSAPDTQSDILRNRVQTNVTARLVATAESGEEIVIDGAVKSKQIGTDILFDGAEYGDRIKDIPLQAMRLEIDDVRLKSPPAAFSLSLNKLSTDPDATLQSYRNFIITSFNSRLAYKSGQIGKNEILGFSNQVKNNPSIVKRYERAPYADNPKYSVQVVSSVYQIDRIDAIVKEICQGNDTDLATDFYLTHRIVAKASGSAWSIVSDEIVETP